MNNLEILTTYLDENGGESIHVVFAFSKI